jgi:type I restriction enzyme S subunit
LIEAHSKLDVFRRSAIEALTVGDETWTTCTLGDVADVNWGDTSLTKASYRDGGFTAFSASGPDGLIEKYDYEQDGVVLSAIGAACGKVFFATGKWSAIKNTICIIPNRGEVSAKYLYYLLNDPNGWPKRGAAQPFIRQADARSRTIRFPHITKQEELIEALERQIWEFERLSGHLKNQIEQLALLRRSILKIAFEGHL